MLSFEWDAKKAAANLRKHKVSFETARRVFQDLYAVGRIDDREDYGEERFIRIGLAGGVLLTVVHTERGDSIRIISARKAKRYEQEEYYQQNAGE